jgi:hypothetical protein
MYNHELLCYYKTATTHFRKLIAILGYLPSNSPISSRISAFKLALMLFSYLTTKILRLLHLGIHEEIANQRSSYKRSDTIMPDHSDSLASDESQPPPLLSASIWVTLHSRDEELRSRLCNIMNQLTAIVNMIQCSNKSVTKLVARRSTVLPANITMPCDLDHVSLS